MALSRVHTWSAGEVLLASDLNAEFNNVLTNANSLISPFTANVAAAGYQLNNLGAASARTDAVQYAQVQNSTAQLLGSVAGTNTVTAALSPTLTAYTSGQVFTLVPANTNTGATTLNIDSVGAKNIFNGGAACVGGELVIGVPVRAEYDGTQFNLIAPGNLATAWTAWTPTVTVDTGSINTIVITLARYQQIGKMLTAAVNVSFTVASGSPTAAIITLPGSVDYNNASQIDVGYFKNNGSTEAVAFITKNTTNKAQFSMPNATTMASNCGFGATWEFEAA